MRPASQNVTKPQYQNAFPLQRVILIIVFYDHNNFTPQFQRPYIQNQYFSTKPVFPSQPMNFRPIPIPPKKIAYKF